MSVDRQDVSLYAGDDLNMAIAILDQSGAALDATGSQFTWTLSGDAGSPALLTKTLTDGVTITDAVSGMVAVSIAHTESAKLIGRYWHQLVMTDVSGDVTTVMTGAFTVKARTL